MTGEHRPIYQPEYATARRTPRRPGLLTAIAVLSVCLGLLGAAGDVLVGLAVPRLYALTAPPPLPNGFAMPTPAPAVAPFTGDLVGPAGLASTERRAIFAKVGAAGWPADRQIMFHRLLGEFGRLAFPDSLPPDEWVTEGGTLPAGPDGLRSLGTNYLRTSNGAAIWVDDAVARLRLKDGTLVRVEHDCAVDVAGKTARASVAVAEDVNRLHQALGVRFNTVQAAVVARRLLAAGPRVKPPYQYRTAPSEFADAHMRDAAFEFGGNVPQWILPDGRTVIGDLDRRDPATGLPLPVAPSIPFGPGFVSLLATDAALGLLLSIFLLACGVRLATDAPNAARLHLIYARLRLAEATLGIGLAYWLNRRTGFVGMSVGAAVGAVVGVAVNVVYPCALLRAFRVPACRRYVEGLGGHVTLLAPETAAKLWRRTDAARSSAGWRAGAVALAVAALGAGAVHAASLARPTPAAVDPEGWQWLGDAVGGAACLLAAAVFAAFAAKLRWPAGASATEDDR